MSRAATILAKPTVRGLVVCAPAFLGRARLGDIGGFLDPLHLLQLARQAAAQGGRLLIEIQPDGRPAFPCELPEGWTEELLGTAVLT